MKKPKQYEIGEKYRWNKKPSLCSDSFIGAVKNPLRSTTIKYPYEFTIEYEYTHADRTIVIDTNGYGWLITDTEYPEKVSKDSLVDHPKHYGGKNNPYEAIKVIEAWNLDFCLGNVVKYISRYQKKGAPVQDLKKALWYLEKRIQKDSE